MKRKGGFGKFLFAGVLGAIGGLLLAPKAGKETRKEVAKLAVALKKKIKAGEKETQKIVKEVFGNKGEVAIKKYQKIKGEVAKRVAAVAGAGKKIDRAKYVGVVDEVIAEFRGELKKSKGGVEALASYLKKDWAKMKKALASEPGKKK